MTGDVSLANQAGINGLKMGAGLGSISGAVNGYFSAGKEGLKPLTGKPKNSALIGEGMDRLGKMNIDIKSETLKGMPDDSYFGREINSKYPYTTREGMRINSEWIELKMETKTWIYDAGPKGTSVSSPYYNMEVGRTMDYGIILHLRMIIRIHTIRIYRYTK